MTRPWANLLLVFLSLAIVLSCSIVRAKDRTAEDVYDGFCSVCHGEKGDGNSLAQPGLIPPPRDFTTPESSVILHRQRMIQSTTFGIPGTAMMPWGSRLTGSEIEKVSDLIRDKFMLPAMDASRGREIYTQYCSVCHGESGQGAMWARQGLAPPPANFTDPKLIKSLGQADMIHAVTFGRVETAMTGWSRRLTASEIELVVGYIRVSFMGINDSGADGRVHSVDMEALLPGKLQGEFDAGMSLYVANCTTCHGEVGDGRGPRAYFINPKPRNFTHAAARSVLNRPALFEAISKGRLYSEMSAWDKVLSNQQIADVVEYVFKEFIQESGK